MKSKASFGIALLHWVLNEHQHLGVYPILKALALLVLTFFRAQMIMFASKRTSKVLQSNFKALIK